MKTVNAFEFKENRDPMPKMDSGYVAAFFLFFAVIALALLIQNYNQSRELQETKFYLQKFQTDGAIAFNQLYYSKRMNNVSSFSDLKELDNERIRMFYNIIQDYNSKTIDLTLQALIACDEKVVLDWNIMTEVERKEQYAECDKIRGFLSNALIDEMKYRYSGFNTALEKKVKE